MKDSITRFMYEDKRILELVSERVNLKVEYRIDSNGYSVFVNGKEVTIESKIFLAAAFNSINRKIEKLVSEIEEKFEILED